jgi:hypothetical protein
MTDVQFDEPGHPSGVEVAENASPFAGDVPIRNGRYWAPLPGQEDKGDRTGWSRVTTVAEAIADFYGLHRWEKRKVAKGFAERPDLVERAGVADEQTQDGRNELDTIVKAALETAKANEGSRTGTSIHALAEAVEKGGTLPASTRPQVRRTVETYLELIRELNMATEYSERVVGDPSWPYCGRLDRLGWHGGALRVMDLKSGKNALLYGGLTISAQLAMYARAPYMWDPSQGRWVPMPPVAQDYGIILWTPVDGEPEARPVDLVEGWENALLAQKVRQARTRGKGLIGDPIRFVHEDPFSAAVTAESGPPATVLDAMTPGQRKMADALDGLPSAPPAAAPARRRNRIVF